MQEGNGDKTKKSGLVESVRQTGLLCKRDRVIAGVSGGADSVCLFLVLKELSEEIGFSLAALHVEHGIRGEDSREDAAFVENLCKKTDTPFLLKEVDVPEAKTTHISIEETARNLRRQAFVEAAAYFFAGEDVKIALAHNAEDQAETVLLHLVRGTGVKGLGGMEEAAPLAPGVGIIRPLLAVERAEIEAYLEEKKQPYRTDATNDEDAYTRNYIRHHILPELKRLNQQAIKHIGQTSAAMRQVESERRQKADELSQEVILDGKLNRIYAASAPPEMQSRLIRAWIWKQNGTVRNITSKHIAAVRALLTAPNGTKSDIPGAYRARADGDWLIWEKKDGRNAPKGKG